MPQDGLAGLRDVQGWVEGDRGFADILPSELSGRMKAEGGRMKAEDIRDMGWSARRQRLCGDRARVYVGLLRYGPLTTRELAGWLKMDVLNVRPRVTELCYLGLARLVGRQGLEGVYGGIEAEVALEGGVEREPRWGGHTEERVERIGDSWEQLLLRIG